MGRPGSKTEGGKLAQEEIWRASHIVLTANENNRNFWLCKEPSKKDGAIKLGSPQTLRKRERRPQHKNPISHTRRPVLLDQGGSYIRRA